MPAASTRALFVPAPVGVTTAAASELSSPVTTSKSMLPPAATKSPATAAATTTTPQNVTRTPEPPRGLLGVRYEYGDCEAHDGGGGAALDPAAFGGGASKRRGWSCRATSAPSQRPGSASGAGSSFK